jgi:hypothetical protein
MRPPWNNRPPDSDFYEQNKYPFANIVYKPHKPMLGPWFYFAVAVCSLAALIVF